MGEARYLLVKRGLYYRPENNGYTGIRDQAGRYPESDASPEDGVTAIHEDEAPLFAPVCWEDLKLKYLMERLDEAATLLEQKTREVERLQAERDDADRRAGSAEREMEHLKDSASRREQWLAKAKADAGYDRNISFDRVWADALAALKQVRSLLPATTEQPAEEGEKARIERAAKALVVAEGFSGEDAAVIDRRMQTVPAWQTRIPRVETVLAAYFRNENDNPAELKEAALNGSGDGWLPIETAPHACHVLACRFDHDCGEWVHAIVASPPIKPFTHWRLLPAPPALLPAEVVK